MNDQRHVIIRVSQDLLPQIVHMKPLNPLKPPFPFTLSDAPSSVVFSLGLSLIFCAPPKVVKVSKPVTLPRQFLNLAEQLTSSIIPHFAIRRNLVLLRRLSRQVAARVAEAALRAALHRPLFFLHQRRCLVESLHGGRVRAGNSASA